MEFFNYVVPTVLSSLDQGHIKAEKLRAIIENHTGLEAYHSVFEMEERQNFVKYKGIHRPTLGWFVLDFDSMDLNEAKNDVVKVWGALGLNESFARVFFSGSKGFHLYIREEFFEIPHSNKTAFAYSNITSDIKRNLTINTLDESISVANHKFRLPGSKHPKTGLYKTFIEYPTFITQDVNELKALSTKPSVCNMTVGPWDFTERYPFPNPYKVISETQPEFTIDSTPHSLAAKLDVIAAINSPEFNALSNFGLDQVSEQDLSLEKYFKEFSDKKCVSKMWEAELHEGERHSVASILISDLFYTHTSRSLALSRIEEWTKKQGIHERFERDYVRMINEQYEGIRDYSYGCYGNIKKKFCSGTCEIFKKLDPEKRAKVNDMPPEVVAQEEKRKEKSDKQKAKSAEIALRKKANFVPDLPDWGEKTPKGTMDNVRHLLKHLEIRVRYDVIRKDVNIQIPSSSFLIDTEKNDKMNHIVNFAMKCSMPYQKVPDFVGTIASANPYNPVAEWIESKPWDKTSRLQDFYNTITAHDESDLEVKEFKETLLKRWMISAIAAAFRADGTSAQGVLVFTGAQYIGKTNWFKNLAPKELRVLKEGVTLDPKDKDSVYQCVSNWLVELGELDATFKKADVAQLKAFLTKDQDTIRLPYHREPATFARRTVFFGSVNDHTYLNDPTGSRRFWTIDCDAINHTHGLDMQQVWAEFLTLFRLGEQWHLTDDEMVKLKVRNDEHTSVEPMEEAIQSLFEWDAKKDLLFFSCSDIANLIQYDKPSKRDLNSIGGAVRKLANKKPKKHNRKRGYWLKLAANKSNPPQTEEKNF